MNLYVTKIIAIDPQTKILTEYCGPFIPGISFEDAENYCQTNGLGYCEVVGKLIETQSFDGETIVNFENLN
ncbi:MAG: hypothetical protein WAW57_15245 [Lutibacter sp.]